MPKRPQRPARVSPRIYEQLRQQRRLPSGKMRACGGPAGVRLTSLKGPGVHGPGPFVLVSVAFYVGGMHHGGVVFLEYISVSNQRWDDDLELWNEEEAVRLLKEAGAAVAWFEAGGARISAKRRKAYHARIVRAHEDRDMVAYREAVNGYEEAAREAYLRFKREEGKAGE
jgi:hypothetical protein